MERKSVIVIVACAFLTFLVVVGEGHTSDENLCERVEEIAGLIMKGRQNGVPLSSILSSSVDENLYPLLRTLAIGAYESPRFFTPDAQERAIMDFRNSTYLECIKALDNK